MLRKINPETYMKLNRSLAQDSARSYFIRLGLMNTETFSSVYADLSETGELNAILCQRRSGTLQLWAHGNGDAEVFASAMGELSWSRLISTDGCCKGLISKGVFETVEPGAWIARLDKLRTTGEKISIEPLGMEDLEEVDTLYDRVFDHHMPMRQMADKLSSGRGRGVLIRLRGRIVCTAQTELEESGSALIVGVATDPDFQRRGLAEACTAALCRALLEEEKTPWLQYDNPAAGRLYEKLGFVKADQVVHCSR